MIEIKKIKEREKNNENNKNNNTIDYYTFAIINYL